MLVFPAATLRETTWDRPLIEVVYVAVPPSPLSRATPPAIGYLLVVTTTFAPVYRSNRTSTPVHPASRMYRASEDADCATVAEHPATGATVGSNTVLPGDARRAVSCPIQVAAASSRPGSCMYEVCMAMPLDHSMAVLMPKSQTMSPESQMCAV